MGQFANRDMESPTYLLRVVMSSEALLAAVQVEVESQRGFQPFGCEDKYVLVSPRERLAGFT